MIQAQLFQDSTQWLTELEADVKAAGGAKVVGHELWPDLDPETAGRKLSNALNTKQKQQLSYQEAQQVKRLARIAVGKSQLHAFESKQLECELHWRTPEDVAQMAAERFAFLSRQYEALRTEMQRSEELVGRLTRGSLR
jgi:hypothetical protein